MYDRVDERNPIRVWPIGERDAVCMTPLLPEHPVYADAGAACGARAEYFVQHPGIVASVVCPLHLAHEIRAMLVCAGMDAELAASTRHP